MPQPRSIFLMWDVVSVKPLWCKYIYPHTLANINLPYTYLFIHLSVVQERLLKSRSRWPHICVLIFLMIHTWLTVFCMISDYVLCWERYLDLLVQKLRTKWAYFVPWKIRILGDIFIRWRAWWLLRENKIYSIDQDMYLAAGRCLCFIED